MLNTEYINPTVLVSPQAAFYARKNACRPGDGRKDLRRVCDVLSRREFRFSAPGEMITPEIIEYIIYAKEKGCSMQGTEDPAVEHLNVLVDDRQVWK